MNYLPFSRILLGYGVALILLTSALSANVSAWGPDGHRIVARIAAKNLSSKARKAILDGSLFDNLPGGAGSCGDESTLEDRMACVANWADAVRDSEFPQTYNWHFVDLFLNQTTYDQNAHCRESKKKGVCGMIALLALAEYGEDDSASFRVGEFFAPPKAAFDRRSALRFIVHMVGDFHQPLHTVADGGGGNSFKVNYLGACAKWKGNKCKVLEATDLHKVWDGRILRGILRIADKTESEYADLLNSQISGDEKNSYRQGDAVTWLEETHEVARDDYSRYLNLTQKGQLRLIDDSYVTLAQPIVILQLKKGGIRLAKVINDIFK